MKCWARGARTRGGRGWHGRGNERANGGELSCRDGGFEEGDEQKKWRVDVGASEEVLVLRCSGQVCLFLGQINRSGERRPGTGQEAGHRGAAAADRNVCVLAPQASRGPSASRCALRRRRIRGGTRPDEQQRCSPPMAYSDHISMGQPSSLPFYAPP